jgi:hypothetical protein
MAAELDGSVALDRDDIIETLEKGAHERRGVSARQLLHDYRAGRLAEPGEVADLLMLGGLLSDDDPLLTAD